MHCAGKLLLKKALRKGLRGCIHAIVLGGAVFKSWPARCPLASGPIKVGNLAVDYFACEEMFLKVYDTPVWLGL